MGMADVLYIYYSVTVKVHFQRGRERTPVSAGLKKKKKEPDLLLNSLHTPAGDGRGAPIWSSVGSGAGYLICMGNRLYGGLERNG